QEGARLLGTRGELQDILDAAFLARLETQVRQLDRNVRRQLAPLNLFEHSEVMIADRGCFRAVRDLLAQLAEDSAEAGLRELARRLERSVGCLAGHEALHCALAETALAQRAGGPLAAGCPADGPACESHAARREALVI